jgi:hypothetical protein
MPLSFDSPRFSLRTADFAEIDRAIADVGHAVVTDVWNRYFLAEAASTAAKSFAIDDSNVSLLAANGQIGSYIGGVTGRFGVGSDETFFLELERTGLISLLRILLKSDPIIDFSERATRRVDPNVPARFTGLHRDHQLDGKAARGLASKRALTLWTPLCDCLDEDTPRLVLLHCDDVLEQRSPREVMLSGLHDPKLADRASAAELDAMFDSIYAETRCYAPHVPLGGLIAFDNRTVHGSYRRAGMRKVRYSFDIRAHGMYSQIKNDSPGVRFQSAVYPPWPQHWTKPWKWPKLRKAAKRAMRR